MAESLYNTNRREDFDPLPITNMHENGDPSYSLQSTITTPNKLVVTTNFSAPNTTLRKLNLATKSSSIVLGLTLVQIGFSIEKRKGRFWTD